MEALDAGDLAALTEELSAAIQRVAEERGSLQEVVTILHEWQESTSWTHDATAMRRVKQAERAYRTDGGQPLDEG